MSLKGDKYETTEEIKFRLESSIVLYDGQPVYISKVNVVDAEDRKEIARVFYYELPLMGRGNGKEVRKYLSSKKFDLAPFKMGYLNHGGEAVFLARTPVRQHKQGLSSTSSVFTDCKGRRSENINFNTLTSSQGFVDMYKGVYPEFGHCGDLLGNNDHSSVAVSRSFAFVIDNDLDALMMMHKGVRCGIAMKGDKALKVSPKFHFLREEMEDHRIPVA